MITYAMRPAANAAPRASAAAVVLKATLGVRGVVTAPVEEPHTSSAGDDVVEGDTVATVGIVGVAVVADDVEWGERVVATVTMVAVGVVAGVDAW